MPSDNLKPWKQLEAHARRFGPIRIASLFDEDADRLKYTTCSAAGMYLDVSKQLIDREVLASLKDLALAVKLPQAIESLFKGDKVNRTEDRPALHTMLRETVERSDSIELDERRQDVVNTRRRVAQFATALRDGAVRGHSGKPIRDVVNLGIGGSHLGPQMVCDALTNPSNRRLRVHFVSNVDGSDITRTLEQLDPKSTLFIVASKSFTTAETLLNARTARAWLGADHDPARISAHFVAVTAQVKRAVEFGIDAEKLFPMWDWVGGRYSLWSAIGLPIAIAIGATQFDELLTGANELDNHFQHSDLLENIPVLMGLIGIWNRNFLNRPSLAVLPYDDRLARLPEFLQQLDMESNGKSVTQDGTPIAYGTAPVVWGGVGTNAQHAFFQQLHQGADDTAIDFVLALRNSAVPDEHQNMLIANCLAQAEGLMRGSGPQNAEGGPGGQSTAHRHSPGNRPNSMLVLDQLKPSTLGALIAAYEHKTYVQAVCWDINAFDQWGVELGKTLAKTILDEIESGVVQPHDASTTSLIARYLATR